MRNSSGVLLQGGKTAFGGLTIYSHNENSISERMNPDEVKHGWCYGCGGASFQAKPAKEFVCAVCGYQLFTRKEIPRRLRAVFDLQVWNHGVFLRGLGGPSPGGAAGELGCHRTMIDKLSKMGVLERSVYNKDGHYVVYISDRSIQKALENKQKTGKWTGSGKESKTGIWKWVRKSY